MAMLVITRWYPFFFLVLLEIATAFLWQNFVVFFPVGIPELDGMKDRGATSAN